ncbi:uncharacterized protein LOC108247133 isoform X2 [Kryptolebias marmoratus]|uniref:uncharacterized protein LOC108247133 isoform X2 n=1 Tax=Kryptolebias marmoratus TaxID=37003 RepID=UPI0018ACF0E2|nr:uncharacterized protein LOC108247133 isoform X2 [Kryptolebias marmoratus]
MACTISEEAEAKISKILTHMDKKPANDFVIVGCGGHVVTPSALYELTLTVFGFNVMVPVLVVPGQSDEMILGSNAIRWLISQIKVSFDETTDCPPQRDIRKDNLPGLMSLLSDSMSCDPGKKPIKVGTAKLKRSVTLQPLTEHLVWAKLPTSDVSLVGCSVIIEPTQSKCRPRQILVGRVVASLYADGCVPVKIVNPTEKPLTLRRNAKVADVSTCVSVHDFTKTECIQSNKQYTKDSVKTPVTDEDMSHILSDIGLQDLDLSSCEVSMEWKNELLQIIRQYEYIFSRHKMDCGDATDFVHRIRLVDDKPFRLPYRRVPPCHYEKLRTALSEMEELGIVRKSQSEYSSPLVLVVKPN